MQGRPCATTSSTSPGEAASRQECPRRCDYCLLLGWAPVSTSGFHKHLPGQFPNWCPHFQVKKCQPVGILWLANVIVWVFWPQIECLFFFSFFLFNSTFFFHLLCQQRSVCLLLKPIPLQGTRCTDPVDHHVRHWCMLSVGTPCWDPVYSPAAWLGRYLQMDQPSRQWIVLWFVSRGYGLGLKITEFRVGKSFNSWSAPNALRGDSPDLVH